jgi:RNA polymerase sigma-54 factor
MHLSLAPTLTQSISPQMRHAIHLLQLNRAELAEQLQQEMVENCVLEEEQQDHRDWQRLLENLREPKTPQVDPHEREELISTEAGLFLSVSLEAHLSWQLQMLHCTEGERQAAHVIIHSLDERGWLASDWRELVEEQELDLEDALSALEIVQHLDPVGCGSRNLEECLMIQVRLLFPKDGYLPRIVEKHLGHLERRHHAMIARDLDLELEDVAEYQKIIRTLEPKPARHFSAAVPHISPDVFVVQDQDGWKVLQNEEGIPRLRINASYQRMMRGPGRDAREFLKEQMGAAEFLLHALKKRQETIQKVMQAILEHQRAFFERGPEHLRPLVMQDIADQVGVHESTVSRVASGKYVQCHHGLFELKFFFTSGVKSISGEQMTTVAVKQRIKRLIETENRARPYSDDQLVQILRSENIDIARRTVAKYRDAFGFPGASARRAAA